MTKANQEEPKVRRTSEFVFGLVGALGVLFAIYSQFATERKEEQVAELERTRELLSERLTAARGQARTVEADLQRAYGVIEDARSRIGTLRRLLPSRSVDASGVTVGDGISVQIEELSAHLPGPRIHDCLPMPADRVVVVGDAGTALLTTDRGASWRRLQTSTSRSLSGVCATADYSRLFVCGTGVILCSDDRGDSWRVLRDSPSLDPLRRITCSADGRILCAVGRGGACWSSLDGGLSFRVADGPGGYDYSWASVDGHGRLAVLGSDEVGNPVSEITPLASVEMGGPFSVVVAPRRENFRFRGPGGILAAVLLRDGHRVVAVGNGIVVHLRINTSEQPGVVTVSWGSTIDDLDLEAVTSVWSAGDAQDLWVATQQGAVLRSRDGGATWVREASVETALNAVRGSPDSADRWAVGDNGVVLHRHAESESWERLDGPVRHALEGR